MWLTTVKRWLKQREETGQGAGRTLPAALWAAGTHPWPHLLPLWPQVKMHAPFNREPYHLSGGAWSRLPRSVQEDDGGKLPNLPSLTGLGVLPDTRSSLSGLTCKCREQVKRGERTQTDDHPTQRRKHALEELRADLLLDATGRAPMRPSGPKPWATPTPSRL